MTEFILQKLNAISNEYSVQDRLKWQGEVVIKHGNLIVRNKERGDSAKWVFICYHLSRNIFVCLK